MHNLYTKILSTFFSALLFISLAVPCFAFEPSSSSIYQGIDVSKWQGKIDFSEVKRSNISIVYIKSSEGKSYVDPYFETNYYNAKANGLKVGFYHYVTAKNTASAKEQAIFFQRLYLEKVQIVN